MSTADHGENGAKARHSRTAEGTRKTKWHVRHEDSYGLVLLLVILDYVAVSIVSEIGWGSLAIFILQGLTLIFALRTSHARQIWVSFAVALLLAGTALETVSIFLPQIQRVTEGLDIVSGILLLVTPVAIVRRIVTHQVVTAETLLGAVCVYVLLGFSFSSAFAAIGFFGSRPFFAGVEHATRNSYLFFSYTTLTTVGYGDLVPASSLGQTLAMLEAMLGQIYLVVVVARLVALWGQALPHNARDS